MPPLSSRSNANLRGLTRLSQGLSAATSFAVALRERRRFAWQGVPPKENLLFHTREDLFDSLANFVARGAVERTGLRFGRTFFLPLLRPVFSFFRARFRAKRLFPSPRFFIFSFS